MFAVVQQVTAALQLAVLLIAVGRGRGTDTYVVLYTASQIPAAVLAIGVLQPLTLNRPGYGGWLAWNIAGCVFTVALIGAVTLFLLGKNYPKDTVLAVAAILTASGITAYLAYVRAVHHAALGHPSRLASITTVGNVAASVLVVVSPTAKIEVMCVGLLLGNIVTYLFVVGRPEGRIEATPLETQVPRTSRKDLAGMLTSSSVGAFGPFALQAVTATYAAGEATILGFASRIVAGVVTVGVTAFLNASTDWRRRSIWPLELVVRVTTPILGCSFIALALLTATAASEVLTTSVAALGLLCGSTSQACAGRALAMTGRLAWFRYMAASNVMLYAGGVVVLTYGAHTASLYFTVMAAMTAAGTVVFSLGVGWRRYAVNLAGLSGLGAVALMVVSLAR